MNDLRTPDEVLEGLYREALIRADAFGEDVWDVITYMHPLQEREIEEYFRREYD